MGKYCNCKVCGRPMKDMRQRGMCNKHYKQFMKYGKCLDKIQRTTFDLNQIVDNLDGTSSIILYNKECVQIARTLIDTQDAPKVKYIKWKYREQAKYVLNTGTRADKRTIHLHRLIMGFDKGEYNDDVIVDHINHDPLDNRKCNLRVVTKSENAMNLTKTPAGVSQMKNGKWQAYIKIHQKHITLGHYILKEEAMLARYFAEKIIFKEFAYEREEPIVDSCRRTAINEYINRRCRDYNNGTSSAQ